jgi:hypothetical protein
MLVRGSVTGVLTAASFRAGHRFGRRDADLAALIAAVAGVVVDQAQRLAAVEHVRRGRGLARRVTAAERAEARVVDSVTRLAAGGPRRTARVAALLAALEALVGERA